MITKAHGFFFGTYKSSWCNKDMRLIQLNQFFPEVDPIYYIDIDGVIYSNFRNKKTPARPRHTSTKAFCKVTGMVKAGYSSMRLNKTTPGDPLAKKVGKVYRNDEVMTSLIFKLIDVYNETTTSIGDKSWDKLVLGI